MVADAVEEAARIRAHRAQAALLPKEWRERVPMLFSDYLWHAFSEPHERLWTWANAIETANSPRPFIAIWPRGRGKSTTAEIVVTDLGVRAVRNYCMYVCGTQDQADKHVSTIARLLENRRLAAYVPNIGRPRVGKNGTRSWSRSMMTTATGYTVEAIGLDRAVRGQKIDWARPDVIVFDDIDERHDSAHVINKKVESMTESIIPAGSTHAAILFAQNLIHAGSIASMLAKAGNEERAAQFLLNRIISGPYKAIEGLEIRKERVEDGFRWKITQGRSLWNGYDVGVCEEEINRTGPSAFARESQHEVDIDHPDALLRGEDFDNSRVYEHPDLIRIGIGVDPPGGATECGIVCVGTAKIGKDTHGYTLEDATQPAGVKTETWALEVLRCYYRNGADVVFVETNYGGDMAMAVIRQTKWLDAEGNLILDGSRINITKVVATRGKIVRAEPVATVYQQGRLHQVGDFPYLEKEWRQYVPGMKSPNRLDAHVWAVTGLQLIGSGWARA